MGVAATQAPKGLGPHDSRPGPKVDRVGGNFGSTIISKTVFINLGPG